MPLKILSINLGCRGTLGILLYLFCNLHVSSQVIGSFEIYIIIILILKQLMRVSRASTSEHCLHHFSGTFGSETSRWQARVHI